jgi:pSer/pThr/pTyr-binding forkhead associated (FHA) protein
MNSKDNDKTIVGGFTLDLIYSIQSEKGEKFIITDESLVGRGKDCEVLIDDKKISRKHAQLKIVNGRLEVTDLDSSNGTFINGRKISKPSNLVNGDVVSFEKHLFTINIAMNDQQDEVVEIEEDDDHTAVMDFTPEQFEKLHKAADSTPLDDIGNVQPEVAIKKENINQSDEKEAVPSSWIEESGSSEGTRMLDMRELEALRAGPREVKSNDSDVTRLHCFVDGQDEEIVELPITDFEQAAGWEIGRDSTCDIVLDHPSVSNRHAQIIHQNGRWKIVNLVSTNGIRINGQKRLSTYLSDGDKVAIGSVNLVIKIPKSQAKKAKKSVQKSSSSKNDILVPALLGLIIIVLMVVIFLYM